MRYPADPPTVEEISSISLSCGWCRIPRVQALALRCWARVRTGH